MDLPDSVSAVAAALAGGGVPEPTPELFSDRDVFAAEFARIFLRPWIAADHVTRLAADGRYFLAAAGPRSLLVTRERAGVFHALRNNCIHAGYPVCEDEDGEADRLLCPYHGWQYAVDGRLVEPRLSTEQEISPRYRLANYPIHVAGGLFFVDPSGTAEGPPPAAPSLPLWLADARVGERRRYETQWNWKHLRRHLWSARALLSAGAPDCAFELGPLCRLVADAEEAVLLQLIPRTPERSDFRLVRMRRADDTRDTRPAEDVVGAAPPPLLGRDFWLWYAALMS